MYDARQVSVHRVSNFVSAARIEGEGRLRTLRTEELSRDVQRLAADDDDLLAAEQLLGNNAGKTAQEVALAINDDLDGTQLSASRPYLHGVMCSS